MDKCFAGRCLFLARIALLINRDVEHPLSCRGLIFVLCYVCQEVEYDAGGLAASVPVLGLLDLRVCRLLVWRLLLNLSIAAVL